MLLITLLLRTYIGITNIKNYKKFNFNDKKDELELEDILSLEISENNR